MQSLGPKSSALLSLLLMATCLGCTGRLAGYTHNRPACVVDPRGVPVEPCVCCEPVPPTCCDSNACSQCRRARETFFDSMYAWICECNCWPRSHCCPPPSR